MKVKTQRKARKSEYDHLTEALVYFDKAIRAMNFIEDPDERFTCEKMPIPDLIDIEDYVENLRDHVLRLKKIKREAKRIPTKTVRALAQAMDFWQTIPDKLIAHKNTNEVTLYDPDTMEAHLIFRSHAGPSRKKINVQIDGTPHTYGMPDYPVLEVKHNDITDIEGVVKKIQQWKEEEEDKFIENETLRPRRRGASRGARR